MDGTGIGTVVWPHGNTSSGGQGEPVQGLNCGLMSTAYHVHAHLSIILNGEVLRVPANVGIVPRTETSNQCTYPTHTHDGTGKIHVEGPVPRRYTLGQFFAIWGQPLSYDNVAGLTGWTVVAYIADGSTVTQYTGDLAEIDLVSHREVTLQLGSPVSAIPNYTWSGD
jgi:hypothetical protein